MKKKFFALALIVASMTGFTGMAQTVNGNTEKTCTEQNCNKKNCKAEKCGKPDCNKGKCDAKGKEMKKFCKTNPFEGIELTEQQKTSLAQLKERCKKDCMEVADFSKKERNKADSTLCVKRMEAKKAYLAEIKNILGPEKYTQFLENSFLKGKGHDMKAFKNGAKDRKGCFVGKDKKNCDGMKGKNCKNGNNPKNASKGNK